MDQPLNATVAVSLQPKRSAELLNTLEAIILADGFARLSVAEIAASLECSKRTIYELAATKNDLVLMSVARFFERIRLDAAIAITKTDNPAQQIFEYLQVGVRAAQRLSPQAVADIHKWEPARKIWQEHVRMRVDGLRELIDHGISLGVFRNIKSNLVAEIVFASINRLREPDFYANTNISISEAFQEFYRLLLAALVQAD